MQLKKKKNADNLWNEDNGFYESDDLRRQTGIPRGIVGYP